MSKDDKTVAAILFGILFVVSLKVIELAFGYFFADFANANRTIVFALSGLGGALIAILIVQRFFPGFLKNK